MRKTIPLWALLIGAALAQPAQAANECTLEYRAGPVPTHGG